MQKEKIDNLGIDLKELTYLLSRLDKEPMLARSAKRLIDLMKERLDEIKNELDQPLETDAVLTEEKTILLEEKDVTKEKSATFEETKVAAEVAVLGEQFRTGLELSKGLTLNETFHFSHELFDGNNEKMNKILQEIGTMHSFDNVVSYLSTHIEWDEEKEATQDFIELLKKYFV